MSKEVKETIVTFLKQSPKNKKETISLKSHTSLRVPIGLLGLSSGPPHLTCPWDRTGEGRGGTPQDPQSYCFFLSP